MTVGGRQTTPAPSGGVMLEIDRDLAKGKRVVVLVKSSTCGNCIAFEPEFRKARAALTKKKVPVYELEASLISDDAVSNAIMTQFPGGVIRVPHVMALRRSKARGAGIQVEAYAGPRVSESVVSFGSGYSKPR